MASSRASHVAMEEEAEEEFVIDSMVRGYHVYQDVWTPAVGERLQCVREEDNAEDRYAVAVTRDGVTVGHLPRRISTLCLLFIRRGGVIRCSVTGHRRYSRDLVQGGMEIPCQLTFVGMGKEIKKIRCNVARDISIKAAATKAAPVTKAEILKKGSSCSKYANERLSNSKQCIVKEEPIENTSAAIDLRNDSCDVGTTMVTTAAIDLRKDSCDVGTTMATTTAIDLRDDGCDIGTTTSAAIDLRKDSCDVGTTLATTAAIDLRKDSCDVGTTTAASVTNDVWITHGNHTLKLSDKREIEQDEEMTDKHIQMAQHLAKIQFPVVGGLQSTLFQQKKKKGSWTANTIQIIYCNKRSHWITASTKFCKFGQVNIYDSKFNKLDAESRITVKQMFGLKKAGDINMVTMQCQKGNKDCGLFAIAVMTSLGFDEDPSTVIYDQDSLRRHFVNCITKGELSLFPKTLC